MLGISSVGERCRSVFVVFPRLLVSWILFCVARQMSMISAVQANAFDSCNSTIRSESMGIESIARATGGRDTVLWPKPRPHFKNIYSAPRPSVVLRDERYKRWTRSDRKPPIHVSISLNNSETLFFSSWLFRRIVRADCRQKLSSAWWNLLQIRSPSVNRTADFHCDEREPANKLHAHTRVTISFKTFPFPLPVFCAPNHF